MEKRWCRNKQCFFMVLLCLLLAGCGRADDGKDTADETQSAVLSSDENEEVIPVYSEADDRAAAEYLKEQYGILPDGNVPKVILDSDMAYFGDDAMCLCILVEADQLGLIDLLGVTITGGNSFVSVGTNSALNQLEYFGREDIPVYMGTDVPLFGFRDLEEQEQIVGSIDRWGGCGILTAMSRQRTIMIWDPIMKENGGILRLSRRHRVRLIL
ncbi:MAG: nucleoside hydrolase [Lachnospiraceae bacterium]|nr:nucleoside hydrolase [Lachnospiraceae bacterium]